MNLRFPFVLLTLAASTFAQTQLVRGDIEDQNNVFFLDCANQVRLVSSTVNLRALHDASRQQDIEYEMQVIDVTSGGQRTLDVISATAIPEQFGMGNLRFGRSDRWEFFSPAGTLVSIWMNARAAGIWAPIPGLGAWLVGLPALHIRDGVTNALGQFQFDLQPPTVPALVGVEFTAQALYQLPSGFIGISNADCKVVRND